MKKNQEESSLSQSCKQLKALIFDLLYDQHRGVIIYVRIFEGKLETKQKIKLLSNQKIYQVVEVGVKTPQEVKKTGLITGEIGWFTANIRNIKEAQVGDTVVDTGQENPTPFPGYKKLKPNIYSNLYPSENNQFNDF